MPEGYLNLTIRIPTGEGNIDYRADVRAELEVDAFIAQIRKEFGEELPLTIRHQDIYLWRYGGVTFLDPQKTLEGQGVRDNSYLICGDNPPNLEPFRLDSVWLDQIANWQSVPESYRGFRLTDKSSGQVLAWNYLPSYLGRPIDTTLRPALRNIDITQDLFGDRYKSISVGHALLFSQRYHDEQVLYLVPMKPQNPVFVNEYEVEHHVAYPLEDSDEIRLGQTDVVVVFTRSI